MTYALKVFVQIIHNRIYAKSEEMSGETQFGFINLSKARQERLSMHMYTIKFFV